MIKQNGFFKAGLLVWLIFSITIAWCQDDVEASKEIELHREKQEAEFRDPEKSPLPPEARKNFEGLNYFPIDLKYRVKAKFVKTGTGSLFKMKTTTKRRPEYRKYGEVHFELNGATYMLEVYQSLEIMSMPEYADYLFIPFTDLTNGQETYEVGRYIDMRIPEGEDVVLDFNKCYNPYCSYGAGYSCPIPPAANDLPIAIVAGEKIFQAH